MASALAIFSYAICSTPYVFSGPSQLSPLPAERLAWRLIFTSMPSLRKTPSLQELDSENERQAAVASGILFASMTSVPCWIRCGGEALCATTGTTGSQAACTCSALPLPPQSPTPINSHKGSSTLPSEDIRRHCPGACAKDDARSASNVSRPYKHTRRGIARWRRPPRRSPPPGARRHLRRPCATTVSARHAPSAADIAEPAGALSLQETTLEP